MEKIHVSFGNTSKAPAQLKQFSQWLKKC